MSQAAQDAMKRQAAEAAVAEVEDGMVLGLGTGSTAAMAVEALAARVRDGLRVVGIPTSERTAAQARGLGIPLATFAEHQRIDLTIDGADEVQRGALGLIKGLGGALLWEKIVASNSARMTVMVDESKLVDRLGEKVRLPVEVVPFGWQATAAPRRGAAAMIPTAPTAATCCSTAPWPPWMTRRRWRPSSKASPASSTPGCSSASPLG